MNVTKIKLPAVRIEIVEDRARSLSHALDALLRHAGTDVDVLDQNGLVRKLADKLAGATT